MIKMIQPIKHNIKAIENLLPKQDPELKLTIKSIPIKENENKIIPVAEPCLIGNEKKYVLDCLESNWISSAGKYITQFEDQFAKACDAKFAISCSSGTTALHLALYVLGIKAGDEVIIPTFTMIATANAVRFLGATPIFVDSDITTWNIDTTQIESKITSKTKAIIPVHIYGQPCDMDAIHLIAKKYNLLIIEDAAEAHGAEYNGKKIGSLSDATCFSFYANKIITTGEGGMITTNNKEFYEKALTIRDHAFSKERHFWHEYLGFNFRMTNLQAAIGVAQVENFEELINRRINNSKIYNSFLKGTKGIKFPNMIPNTKNVFWMYGILITEEAKINRDQLRYLLAENGIETRTFFIPTHLQPIYYNPDATDQYPVAEYLCKHGLYLPSSGNLSIKDIQIICNIIVAHLS